MTKPEKPNPTNDLLGWLGISDAPNWQVSRLLGWLLGTLLVVVVPVLFLAALLAAFAILFHTVNLALSGSNEGLNLGAGALIAALLGAPFLIWGTWLKYQTVRYQKEGHITDRINKAVEMLGAEKKVDRIGRSVTLQDGNPDFVNPGEIERRTVIEWQGMALLKRETEFAHEFGDWTNFSETIPNIEVRIGAILSLERIAQDSTTHDKGRDHVRLMEILCAYIRENSKAEHLDPTVPPFTARVPRMDIQKAIDVIKRRSSAQMQHEADARYRLDLRSVNFDGTDLSKGDFTGANFIRSRFELAKLDQANLTGAKMAGCLLNFASWHKARLRGTSLDYCILNLPKPTPGGMNDFTPMFGEVEGISVIGSDLSAIDYFGESEDVVFGSKDTVLCDEMDVQRNVASKQFRKRQTAISRKDRTKILELDAEMSGNPFKNWMPYDGADMATGHLRQQRFAAWGLTGWPFDD
jgi:hypothetical protein